MEKKNVWEKYQGMKQQEVFDFGEGYKSFLSACKTERECVKEFVQQAQEAGYRDLHAVLKEGGSIASGDKLYAVNMDKSLMLFVIGRKKLTEGMNILGAHIDSPRLDIKQNPLYEDTQMALLDTHYYGGVKKYQWVALPLAIHGVVVKKDGDRKSTRLNSSHA